MMRAFEPEVFDMVFKLVRARIPEPPVHPKGGCRRRIANEICFKGLFWRAVTGLAWETIEIFLDRQVSDTTLRARRDEWVKAGVFGHLMEDALTEYDRVIGIDTEHVIIDGSNQLAPGGGPDTSAYWGSKGRLGYKWSVAVDAAGIALGFVVDTASRNDYPLLEPTLDTIFERDPDTKIGNLHLDRGYGYKGLPEKLDGYPITNVKVIPRKQPGQGPVPLVGFGYRWIVERTNSWLTNFRSLKRNWDRDIQHRQAAISFALATITIYKIVDHKRTTPSNH